MNRKGSLFRSSRPSIQHAAFHTPLPCYDTQLPTNLFHPPPFPPLERVVLGRNLLDEVVSEDGHLLHNILAHAGHLGEEEEREEAGYTAEACGETAAVGLSVHGSKKGMLSQTCGCSLLRVPRKHMGDVLPDNVVEGPAVVVAGNRVPARPC